MRGVTTLAEIIEETCWRKTLLQSAGQFIEPQTDPIEELGMD